MGETLQIVKKALRIATDAFNDELELLITACHKDLGIAGVDSCLKADDELIKVAVIAFCKWRFGEPDNAEQMQKLYEMQKAQLMVAHDYTDYNGGDM